MVDLTLKEQRNVRTAIRLLRWQAGGWEPLAKLLHFKLDTVQKITYGRRGVSLRTASAIARFAGVDLGDLLSGRFAPAGTCPHCGKAPDFADEDTTVEDGPRPIPPQTGGRGRGGLKVVR